jgi:hypothetical protein
MRDRRKGSTVILVIIISTALSIGIFSVMGLVDSEFRSNKKAALHTEAKHAVEAMMHAGTADLRNRFESRTSFPVDGLNPSVEPLSIPSDFISMNDALSGSHLVLPSKNPYDTKDDFNTEPTEIIGGRITPGEWRFIDRRIPGNEFDELAGTRVFERNIEMLSKATVKRSAVGESTVYARQLMQVRDAPLFAYAIFYNLPMEIAPGPEMEVFGSVHVNADSWFQANKGLDFHGKVTTAGKLFHGRHPDSGKSSNNGGVYFANASESLVNLQEDSSWPSEQRDLFGGGWLTSDDDDFYDLANQLYEGNLQTGDHGVLPQHPVGVTDYVEDTDTSTSAKEALNPAYAIIQPVLNKNELDIPSAAVDPVAHKIARDRNEVEKQKYAYKAGMVIQVAGDGSLTYGTYERNADNEIEYESDGSPKIRQLVPSDNFAVYSPFLETSGEIVGGMHDRRQAADLNMVEIDVEKFKDLVHDNDESDWGGSSDQKPEKWWNGTVYVEFETEDATSSRPDFVNPAKSGFALKLKNGKEIPSPDFSADKGMTVATNQMLYVQGHYNSDGNLSTGSPTEPDKPGDFGEENEEAPAALVADSLTFLSENWDDKDSASSLSDRSAQPTEVSAAVMTGLVPSGKDGSNSYSGGVENFPRFLEDWAGKDLVIRGSMVALFESEVGASGLWGYGDVYKAPGRKWGFNEKFAEGFLPPGTPNTRRYRAIDFELVDQSTYNARVDEIKKIF